MTTYGESTVSRTPTEVWLNIVDHIVADAHFFAYTFDGDDWSGAARECFQVENWHWEYERRRRQIKSLGMVCRSWKRVSDLAASLLASVKPLQAENLDLDAIAHAERILVSKGASLSSDLIKQPVRWRVLHTYEEQLKDLSSIDCPALSRLELFKILSNNLSSPHAVVESLIPFSNITWFGYRTFSLNFPDCNADDHGQKITLPILQALQYHGHDGFHFPFYRFELPSLRHLAIEAKFNPDFFPIWKHVVDAYGETLESLYIKPTGPILWSNRQQYFPSWSSVPHLRELALDIPISLRFHPLPQTHPLRILAVQVWMIDDLCSWLDSENLRVIRMVHASRKPNGGLFHSSKIAFWHLGLPEIGQSAFEKIEAKAASRGIYIRPCKEPSGRV